MADGSAVLATERVHGRPLGHPGGEPPTDELLRAVWEEVAKLHGARIAHRDLRLANVLVDCAGRPWITDFGYAQSVASSRRLAQDRAELLASLGTVTGVEGAVAAAAEVLGPAALLPTLPLLQPMALTAATRRDVRHRPHLLTDLRAAVARAAGVEMEAAPPKPLTRVRPRTVAALLVGAVAVHVLVPQAAELRHTLDALRGAHWAWLVPAAAASALTYVMAALAITAASGLALPIGRTTLVQLASSAANRLAPGGLGGAVTNVRYLQRSGLDRTGAVTAVGLTSAVGFVVHAVGLAAVGIAVSQAGVIHPRLPHNWTVLVAVAVALALAGLLLGTPFARRRLRPVLATTARGLGELVRSPRRTGVLILAAGFVTGGYILALTAALHAFGAHPSLVTVAAAYLAGAAIGSASPTPGGLGAVEAALVAGLTRLGVAAGPAVAGVLSFRLVTYWLPTLPGALAVRVLRRRQAL
jgi:uncharacterized membrane protein YbhN (UPF0104 family)